ncbi:MAG: hypothetical protein LAT53_07365 [Idiomarina sp.]|nr:hypothetical protein [Idiomarina sp.]
MARIHAHDDLVKVHNENNRQLRADEADLTARIEEFDVRRELLSWFNERAVGSCAESKLQSVSYHTWQDVCESREISPEFFARVADRRFPCW